MKVLNLYAGIGGNRKLWQNVEVTAVEHNPAIANIYADFFPHDKIIVADAHKYLLKHYDEFDFIWCSPPCPSHSRAKFWGSFRPGFRPVYPDMKLWQEIIFLKHFSECFWVVENVIPYYQPLVSPSVKIGRHFFWSDFYIPQYDPSLRPTLGRAKNEISVLKSLIGLDIDKYVIKNKRQVIRNCVIPEIGLHILNAALCKQEPTYQELLFPLLDQ